MRGGTGQGVQILFTIFTKINENIYVIKMITKCDINLVDKLELNY